MLILSTTVDGARLRIPSRRPTPLHAPQAAAHFYRTTSDDSYGSFAKPPSLPNTTGALKQPLFLATGVGAQPAA